VKSPSSNPVGRKRTPSSCPADTLARSNRANPHLTPRLPGPLPCAAVEGIGRPAVTLVSNIQGFCISCVGAARPAPMRPFTWPSAPRPAPADRRREPP
jgi:hypothetical protein